jgi:hypothetical protein
MPDNQLTVAELAAALEEWPGDEPINIQQGGAVGEAVRVTRNADGVLMVGR